MRWFVVSGLLVGGSRNQFNLLNSQRGVRTQVYFMETQQEKTHPGLVGGHAWIPSPILCTQWRVPTSDFFKAVFDPDGDTLV